MTKAPIQPADLPDPEETETVLYNPNRRQLLKYASDQEQPTEYGSPSYISEFKSRSADRTWNTVDHRSPATPDETPALTDDQCHAIADDVQEYLEQEELVCVDVAVGPETTGRYFVPEDEARIALSLTTLMEPTETDVPDFYSIQLPERDELEIVADPDTGTTVISGTDYTGEAKKSFLRQFMYEKKQNGGLGIHAGAKTVLIEHDGEMQEIGQVYQGLSGTGKSTLTGHGFWLDDPEETAMIGDDVGALMPTEDGVRFIGTEGNGLYIKTDGLDEGQPELYDAATATDAVLENVTVYEDGTVDFDSEELPNGETTANSRAAIRRDDLDSAAEDITLETVDQYFFITRNPVMPPITELTDVQAAATFMLGESIETGAGDPDSRGEAVRVVGVNPFIMGSRGEEGNRFNELIEDSDIDTYLLNTGSVGERDISVDDTVQILDAVSRGDIEWKTERYGTEDHQAVLTVPQSVPDMDIESLDPSVQIDDLDEQREQLLEERKQYLKSFDDLDDDIIEAVY